VSELRRDYFTNRLVITNTERGNRGTEFTKEEASDSGKCFACEHVSGTKKPFSPVAIDHPQGLAGNFEEASKTLSNNHLALIASPKHDDLFQKLAVETIAKVLMLAQENMKSMYSKKETNFVLLFARHGYHAGAPTSHPNLELLALPQIPPIVAEEIQTAEKSRQDFDVCPMCRVVSVELGGPRQLISTSYYIAFAPWAPTSSHEFWISPKAHQTSFLRSTEREINDLALVLRSTLGGLSAALGSVSFTMIFHSTNEKSSEHHWHIEVHPKLKDWGSLERGLDVFLNDIPPETTGEVLGRASRKELAELVGVI
jgi:UDPglucose--hexose-1-phosphate uridylyltransferase